MAHYKGCVIILGDLLMKAVRGHFFSFKTTSKKLATMFQVSTPRIMVFTCESSAWERPVHEKFRWTCHLSQACYAMLCCTGSATRGQHSHRSPPPCPCCVGTRDLNKLESHSVPPPRASSHVHEWTLGGINIADRRPLGSATRTEKSCVISFLRWNYFCFLSQPTCGKSFRRSLAQRMAGADSGNYQDGWFGYYAGCGATCSAPIRWTRRFWFLYQLEI